MKNDGRSLRINAKSGRASISLNAIPFLLDPTRRSEINGYITNTVKEIWGNVIIIVEKLLKRIDRKLLQHHLINRIMKKIKGITVEVKYTVILNDIEVDDDTYNSLTEAYDNGGEVNPDDPASSEVSEWLGDNIHESDAVEWEYSINDFDEDQP